VSYKVSIVITCLLDHDPDTRPTALELSQSPLLPARLEDEYFKSALGMMGTSSCYAPIGLWYSHTLQ
jgi:hypothetical protein